MLEEEKIEEEKKEENKEKDDQNDRKMFAILAYLGILVFVPFFIRKDDPFVKFHIKQGFVLLVLWMFYFFVLTAFPFFWAAAYYLLNLFSFLILILMVVGIVNVLNDKEKELPLIGRYGEKFDI